MGRTLKFGGPGLSEGQHTIYHEVHPKTKGIVKMSLRADHGDEVDADTVHDPEGFIARKQASYVVEASESKKTNKGSDDA